MILFFQNSIIWPLLLGIMQMLFNNSQYHSLRNIYIMVPISNSNLDSDYLNYDVGSYLKTNGEVQFFDENNFNIIINNGSLSGVNGEILIDPTIGLYEYDILQQNPNLKLTFTGGVIRALLLDNAYVLKIEDSIFALSKVDIIYSIEEIKDSYIFGDMKSRKCKIIRWLNGIKPITINKRNAKYIMSRSKYCEALAGNRSINH